MKSNYDYRSAASKSLKGKWTQSAITTLIFVMIINLSSMVDYLAFRSNSTIFFESYNSIYTIFVILPATFAFLTVFLRVIRKPETDVIRSFGRHFTGNYGRATLSMLLMVIIATCFVVAGLMVSVALASIPFSMFDVAFGWTNLLELHSLYALKQVFHSLNLLMYVALCGFLFILSIIPMLMYLYRICLFPFIIEDNPDIGIHEAFHHSKTLMKGHRMQFFLLDLSFIGWYLLSIPTLGIALLWIMPYQQAARAHFYNDLKIAYDKSQYLTFE